jgi:bifunctional non-homologous end joining protein LigD
MVFDLDPGPGAGMGFVIEVAVALREVLSHEGIESWPKLTGGKGGVSWCPSVRARCLMMRRTDIAEHSRSRLRRGRLTKSAALSARDGRLFIDYLRNGRGTTAVATYSPRARRGFPIAAPTSWQALEGGIRPDAFTLVRPWMKAPAQTVRASIQQASRAENESRISPVKRAKGERRQRTPSSLRDRDR